MAKLCRLFSLTTVEASAFFHSKHLLFRFFNLLTGGGVVKEQGDAIGCCAYSFSSAFSLSIWIFYSSLWLFGSFQFSSIRFSVLGWWWRWWWWIDSLCSFIRKPSLIGSLKHTWTLSSFLSFSFFFPCFFMSVFFSYQGIVFARVKSGWVADNWIAGEREETREAFEELCSNRKNDIFNKK